MHHHYQTNGVHRLTPFITGICTQAHRLPAGLHLSQCLQHSGFVLQYSKTTTVNALTKRLGADEINATAEILVKRERRVQHFRKPAME